MTSSATRARPLTRRQKLLTIAIADAFVDLAAAERRDDAEAIALYSEEIEMMRAEAREPGGAD